jgi:hypothetical protein
VTEGSSPGTGALTLTVQLHHRFCRRKRDHQFWRQRRSDVDRGTTLSIYNWDGLPAGNGNDQLIFGINNNALTASQLAQVNFFSGSGTGFLGTATILSDGELVPIPSPAPFSARSDCSDWLAIANAAAGAVKRDATIGTDAPRPPFAASAYGVRRSGYSALMSEHGANETQDRAEEPRRRPDGTKEAKKRIA